MLKRRSPLLSDEPHELLDHLEIASLTDADGNGSAAQLRSDLGLAGSNDAVDADNADGLTESERIEGIIDAVLTEAEGRIRSCGEENYSFTLRAKALLNCDSGSKRVYTFLLLLSVCGESAVPSVDAAKLFEDVSAHAARVYLGTGTEPAHSFVFGFPRRIGPKDFPGALDELCHRQIREGQPDTKMPGASQMKDAGLDIVTWKPFADHRASKLVAFGQCATGQNWREKKYELQPSDWCRTWMLKTPQVHPAKMFFVPHAVSDADWATLGFQAGIIFDRLRIAHCAELHLPESVRTPMQKWNRAVIAKLS